MIETLEESRYPDFVETIGVAFGDHPMMPEDPSGTRPRRMAAAMLEAFRDAPDVRVFGIRRHGKLDCAALVYNAAYEPTGLKLVVFLFRMFRVFGWTASREFARVMSEKPEAPGRPLELLLLGTRTQSHGQGLGRIMLQHIYEFAREKGYDSVVLEVAKDTPAFGFYLREGFFVDKELAMPTTPLCFVRRPVRTAED